MARRARARKTCARDSTPPRWCLGPTGTGTVSAWRDRSRRTCPRVRGCASSPGSPCTTFARPARAAAGATPLLCKCTAKAGPAPAPAPRRARPQLLRRGVKEPHGPGASRARPPAPGWWPRCRGTSTTLLRCCCSHPRRSCCPWLPPLANLTPLPLQLSQLRRWQARAALPSLAPRAYRQRCQRRRLHLPVSQCRSRPRRRQRPSPRAARAPP